MFTKGTDEVLGKNVAFIYIAANFTYIAFACVWLGFNVCVVVSVGHRFGVINNSCLGNGADKHTVSVKVHVLLNL